MLNRITWRQTNEFKSQTENPVDPVKAHKITELKKRRKRKKKTHHMSVNLIL